MQKRSLLLVGGGLGVLVLLLLFVGRGRSSAVPAAVGSLPSTTTGGGATPVTTSFNPAAVVEQVIAAVPGATGTGSGETSVTKKPRPDPVQAVAGAVKGVLKPPPIAVPGGVTKPPRIAVPIGVAKSGPNAVLDTVLGGWLDAADATIIGALDIKDPANLISYRPAIKQSGGLGK